MTIEEKVFQRKRFVPDLMRGYGFSEDGGSFRYEAEFMGKSFHASICIRGAAEVTAKVIDAFNDEEYFQIRNESLDGPYVSLVRTEYEKLLSDIASRCCTDVLFASDQANRIADFILEQYGVRPDFPWDEVPHRTSGVFRHKESGKWFGLIMRISYSALLKNGDIRPVDVINLKMDPDEGDAVRSTAGVFPAYHMNHEKWISVTLDDQLADEVLMHLVQKSYALTS